MTLISNTILFILQGVLLVFYIHRILTPKSNRHSFATGIFFTVFAAVIYGAFAFIPIHLIVKISALMSLLFAGTIVFYQNCIREKLTCFIQGGLISLLCLIISNLLGSFIVWQSNTVSLDVKSLFILIIYNIIFAAVLTIRSSLIIKLKTSHILYMIVLIGLLLIQTILFVSNTIIYADVAIEHMLFFSVLTMILCIAIDGAIYLFFNSIRSNLEKESSYKLKNTYQNMNIKYYELALDESQKTRRLKHDILNYIQTIYALVLLDNPEKRKIGIEMLETLKTRVLAIPETYFCENEIVNVILTIKNAQANNHGIKTKIHAQVPQNLSIESVDLCSAISNLFDNAIEACKQKLDFRYIDICIAIKQGYLIIKILNTISPESAISFDTLSTTKLDAHNHGFGFKILKDLSGKYDGNFEIYTKDEKVTAILSLKI